MVHVVGAKSGAHELLEEIGFLVAALGRAEAGKRLRPTRVANLAQLSRREIERLVPGRFPKDIAPAVGIDAEIGGLRHAGFAHERLGQAMLVMNVVEAVTALDAQALLVRGSIAPFDANDRVVLDVIRELTADAAVRTYRVHGPVRLGERGTARRGQRARGTRLYAFAARDARAGTHRVVQVEHDLGIAAAARIADDVVDLLFATRAHAPRALNACVQIHRDGRMRHVRPGLCARREAWLADGERT